MNKLLKTDVWVESYKRGSPFNDSIDVVVHKTFSRISFRCSICGEDPWGMACLPGINIHHLIEAEDCYYVIPSTHSNCRAIFELNPLVYE